MSNVSGVAILGLIKFIKKNHHNDLHKMIKALPAESSQYMQQHLLVTKWYPYKLYTDLLRAFDKVVGKGDLTTCIEQGRLSAQHDLSTVFKGFMSFNNTQMMVSRVMVAWSSYYDTGRAEIPVFTDKEATYFIKDFPDVDLAHVKNVQGWVEQFLLITGKFKNVKSEIRKCQCFGDPVTEIYFTFNS